ncbi:hypothetical protein [Streptomyces sp. NPDC053069]|uniref:hypothetical protein n=1 Tax=Streptomyces sp. NPDC053069 TaxID=3365695 RepID=UPI0037D6C8F2
MCGAVFRPGALGRRQHRFPHPRLHHGPGLTNAGPPVTVAAGGWTGRLDRARTLLLPAALGEVRVDGPADVLFGHLPDLAADIDKPLTAAGHGPAAISALGDVP